MIPFYFTECGNCEHFKPNKKLEKNEWQGKCKRLGIKRNCDSDSCNKVKPIDESKATVGRNDNEPKRYGDDW